MNNVVEGDKGLGKIYNLSAWTIRRWRIAEGLPHIVIGGRILYNVDRVDAWLTSKETALAQSEPESPVLGKIRVIRE